MGEVPKLSTEQRVSDGRTAVQHLHVERIVVLTPMFAKALPHYQKTYQPIYNDIKTSRHIQLALPMNPITNLYSTYHAHVKMGQFYEHLTKALFGGQLCDSIIECKNGKGRSGIKPDIIDRPNEIAIESKANRSGHHMNLLDDQMESYRLFQTLNESYTIYFVFYRHGYKRIKSIKESLADLHKNLSQKTYAAIKLPFDIVYTMWKHKGFKRYVQKTWHYCTIINSTFMNMFLFEPQKALTTIGLNLNEFDFYCSLSSQQLSIEGCLMDQFLIVDYKSKNYSNWSDKLVNKVPF